MARTTITQVTDDIDGSKDAKEVGFAWDGVEYTIDLSKKNRTAFEKAMQPYLEAATRKTARGGSRRGTNARGSRRDLAAVRDWAKAQGIEVSARGRVSKSVLDQYDAAN